MPGLPGAVPQQQMLPGTLPGALPQDSMSPIPVTPDEPPVDAASGASNLDDENVRRCALALFEEYKKEEQDIRETRIAFWKKLENYFDGIQNIFFDYGARDWRRVDSTNPVFDPNLYDKIVNIYRAHGESIIAALSVKLPRVIFYPDDADSVEDVDTARACNDIKKLVEKDNNGTLCLIKALYYLWNQGVAAAYIYNRASDEYGTVKVPQYGDDVPVHTTDYYCPVCTGHLDQQQVKGQDPQHPDMAMCPKCGPVSPIPDTISEMLPQMIGYTDEAKSRTIIDVFGPMSAQMPFYARKQEHIPYLLLRFEQHEALLKSVYRDVAEKIKGRTDSNFDRTARMQNNNWDSNQHLVTTSCCWFRPWSFSVLAAVDAEMMTAKFPDGLYAVILNDNLVAETREESLDKHWAVTHSPLGNFIHTDPLGKTLAPVQDIRNEAVDLSIETFEHSIPETFADPDVLNFEAYGETAAAPGMKYEAKPKAGRSLGESFHTIKTATVNDEMENFIKRTDADGQFVSGSFPSIYGGPNTSGSKTAKEYSESRAMALQRLNITFTVVKDWWARVMACSVQNYITGMIEDTRIVSKAPGGSGFVNKWIKQSELTGKIGRVEADAEEELPSSYAQIKSTIMELVTLNSDNINAALFDPANSPIIAKAIGIPDAKIPGADSRDKQIGEIAELLKGPPIPPMPPGMPPAGAEMQPGPEQSMQGQQPMQGEGAAPQQPAQPMPAGPPQSTVAVNVKFDDHEVEMDTITTWANSPEGLMEKQQNPAGFANVEAHYAEHEQALLMKQMQDAQKQMLTQGGPGAAGQPESQQSQSGSEEEQSNA